MEGENAKRMIKEQNRKLTGVAQITQIKQARDLCSP